MGALAKFLVDAAYRKVTRDQCYKAGLQALVIASIVLGGCSAAAFHRAFGKDRTLKEGMNGWLLPISPMIAILFIAHDIAARKSMEPEQPPPVEQSLQPVQNDDPEFPQR